MPKVKVPRKSTSVDMTAMTDVAFLLLTFFMLATKFKPDEPIIVDTPSSVSEIVLPEQDVMILSVDGNGRVFFGIDGQYNREGLIQKMAAQRGVSFTPEEIKQFSLVDQFGVPFNQLKQYLALNADQRSKFNKTSPGIPMDSLNNELGDWIWQARLTNNNIRVAIKGDMDTQYPVIKRIIEVVQDKKVNRFNFITSMEADPRKTGSE
ncbi:MAG: biopolymer transporter ExbD [Bacteroidia bacterium]|nr:biopolymer transporter ExbD [Bacteroidia bacterium]